eukprot:scaffold401_cov152-Amphora_coffeaeformis.AAC.4
MKNLHSLECEPDPLIFLAQGITSIRGCHESHGVLARAYYLRQYQFHRRRGVSVYVNESTRPKGHVFVNPLNV